MQLYSKIQPWAYIFFFLIRGDSFHFTYSSHSCTLAKASFKQGKGSLNIIHYLESYWACRPDQPVLRKCFKKRHINSTHLPEVLSKLHYFPLLFSTDAFCSSPKPPIPAPSISTKHLQLVPIWAKFHLPLQPLPRGSWGSKAEGKAKAEGGRCDLVAVPQGWQRTGHFAGGGVGVFLCFLSISGVLL